MSGMGVEWGDAKNRICEKLRSGMQLDQAVKSVKEELLRLVRMIGASEEAAEIIDQMVNQARDYIRRQFDNIEYIGIPTLKKEMRENWYTGPDLERDLFWPGYRKYLQEAKHWDNNVINNIDVSSTKILSLNPPPYKESYHSKGLVVGYIQSGKTANMTAVMSKAADAGWQFFIVLAGMTDILRRQTQERIEKDLVQRNPTKWHPWTQLDRDFNLDLEQFPPFAPDHRYIAVVKKNYHILGRLLNYLRNTPAVHLQNCGVMIFDDECDQASVNAARCAGENMTAINGLIRQILEHLPRVSYLGYTATPFANILISPAPDNPELPNDLYPERFIHALPYPSDYFGAERLFGRELGTYKENGDNDRYEYIRTIPDSELTILRPPGRKAGREHEFRITYSLDKAIKYFSMATATRILRGQEGEHSSMLVHNTLYVQPHLDSGRIIEEFVQDIERLLASRDEALLCDLETIWNDETSRVNPDVFGYLKFSFKEIMKVLPKVFKEIEVVVENSQSESRLEFENPSRRYIVVGGNILSRGLTIEGLVVSFFARRSLQYDSLMQMGRWFGYRKGYEDLPRIWMPWAVQDHFRDLALVESEIRDDIALYDKRELTPMDFATRIRQLPALAITARSKMQAARPTSRSYSDYQLQTRRFRHKDADWLGKNWGAGSKLINRIIGNGITAQSAGNHVLFKDVDVSLITEFLSSYQVHSTHEDINTDEMTKYIKDQIARSGELKSWNVGVIQKSEGEGSIRDLGQLGKIGTIVRSKGYQTSMGDADIRGLMSKGDLLIDCDGEKPSLQIGWGAIREYRANSGQKNPLLLLYPINARSEPVRSRDGEPLDAVMDVLGMGLLFPHASVDTPIYVQVELPLVEVIDEDEEEMKEAEEEMEADDVQG